MQAFTRTAPSAPNVAGSLSASLLSCLKYGVTGPTGFTSRVFQTEKITCAGREETILRGGRHLFSLLPKAFAGIKQIGVVGWGSQGPAQAQNLRESLDGTGIKVKVGLRPGSKSFKSAEEKQFLVSNGTLGPMYDVIHESDLTILLISDAAMAQEYPKVFKALRPNSFIGLSHGFLLGHLQSRGENFPDNIGVVAVCPKGMGPSVRRLYEQGREVNGAGINSSFAVYQDLPNGSATDIALGWSIAIGSPVTFQTTLESEYKSDIFGERGILLGAVHGICEVLYRYLVKQGVASDEAYLRVVEGITRPISQKISQEGIYALYNYFKGSEKTQFEKAYTAAFKPAMDILMEIYDDVAGGREIPSVIDHARRHCVFPFSKLDSTELWSVAETVRANGVKIVPLDPIVAGVYAATMVAQCDLLIAAGHAYSEVANESVIEAVDSLNPYMRFKGVSYMVDNCSTTARLGSRKWAPRFDYIFDQQTIPRLLADNIDPQEIDSAMNDFKNNKIHEILRICASMRPPVDIMPETTHLG